MVKGIYKNFVIAALTVIGCFPLPLYAVGDLWLPIAYQHHYNSLLKASKIANSDPDCYELIKGQLAESHSSEDHPVFKFYCRSESRRLFTILVDGITFELTSVSRERAKLREARKQAEIDKEIEEKRKKIARYWNDCYKLFKHETRLFNRVKVGEPIPPEPKISSWGRITYRFKFHAQSLQKKTIAYQVVARIEKPEQCEIKIKPL